MNNRFSGLPLPPGVPSTGASVAARITLTEGPAVDAQGNVYFSDIYGNRIWKYATDGRLTIFREPSHRTNGNCFDQQGRLWHCEGSEFGPVGGRRIARTDLAKGVYEVVTDRFAGVRYNSPNDLCVDGRGRV